MKLKTEEVQRFNWLSIITPGDGTPAEIVEALNKYFEPFAAIDVPADNAKEFDSPCLGCGESQVGLLRGRFTWGIAHGEGHCSNCGWPARMYHDIRDSDGVRLMYFRLLLQYHPDCVAQEAWKPDQ